MQIKIPKRFTIFNEHYVVKQLKKVDGEDAWGEHSYADRTIKLKRGLDDAQKERTFFHELMHCALEQLGWDKLSADEKFVDQMGTVLHQIIVTMK